MNRGAMDRQQGVAIGVVRDRDDPQREGRLKVAFPWLPGAPSSPWAPVAASLAGPEFGTWFMPEVDDEVLVAFEHGDFAHPFVVGFLWNGRDKPPETDPKKRVVRTPGGHELRFEDAAGAKKVVVKTEGGHRIELSDADRKVTIQSTAGLAVVLNDAEQALELKGPGGHGVKLSASGVSIS